MCKFTIFFKYQLHLMLLLLNVFIRQFAAGDSLIANTTIGVNNLKLQSSQVNNNKILNLINESKYLNKLNKDPIYTNQYVVHLNGGSDVAKELSEKHGFIFLGQIFENYYHLKHQRLQKRSLKPAHYNYHENLMNEPEVSYVKQQTLKKRVKRDFMPITSHNVHAKTNIINLRFNDPKWSEMWYIFSGRGNNGGFDMNIQKVWEQNITGKGVVVTILDDGLEKDHPDLITNYDEKASFDVNNLDPDPQPRYDMLDSNRHGTRCAGEVAAAANNNLCGMGIAYDSKIGGVRMLDGEVTDAVEARSLSLQNQHIHIYSASWGPDDDGKTVDGPGELATRAFVDGVTKGRGGLGSIFIWASGNGGREHDNCNCDGYTNSIWTLSISSATENGLVPWYSEACSSTLATTYSSGAYGEKQIITTDLHHGCTNSHTGTSASAPLAAGIAALTLQANPKLTWRDMQHLVVLTANPGNLQSSDWRLNGVGRKVSHSFGYGLMDAQAMVNLAKEWVTVPPQKICETRSNPIDKSIPSKSYVELSLEVHCDKVKYLEHVQAKLNLTTNCRGDIHIYLISPSGTRSTLVTERPMDKSRGGFLNWPFMTVHTWGEKPEGKWKLEIHNEGKYNTNLKEWTLIMYGTSENPDRKRKANISNKEKNNFKNKTEISINLNNGRLAVTPLEKLNNFLDKNLSEMKMNLSKIDDLYSSKLAFKNQTKENVDHGISLNNEVKIPANNFESTISSLPFNPVYNEPLDNEIDKSTRAEKSEVEKKPLVNYSEDHSIYSGKRINTMQQQPKYSIKSDGRGGSLGEYEHADNNGNSNRFAYGCSPNAFYFHGFCLERCPDSYYGSELIANLDSLNTPVNNLDKESTIKSYKKRVSKSIDVVIKNMKSLNKKKRESSLINEIIFNSNDKLKSDYTTPLPTLTSSPVKNTDQIHFFGFPYISHNSIKQKDLNRITLLRQQELTESFKLIKSNLYQQLIEDESEKNENNSIDLTENKKTNDERLEKINICLRCHYTCKKCSGRKLNQCTVCFSDSELTQNGRCIFKDLIKSLNELNSTSVTPYKITFDSRVQNWITICSLLISLFFSMAFFYLLLFKKDYTHEMERNSRKYFNENKNLPIKEQKQSWFIVNSFKIYSNKTTSQQNKVRYNNLPLRIELATDNETCEEIT